MIVETTAADYAALLAGVGPRGLALADTPIAPPEVMQMLADVAAAIRTSFTPASWLVMEADEVIGLISLIGPATDGVIDIGYGIAPGRQRRGFASRAIADVVAWAHDEARITALTATTSPDNLASQKVLVRAGFVRTGERTDGDDGRVFCWRCQS